MDEKWSLLGSEEKDLAFDCWVLGCYSFGSRDDVCSIRCRDRVFLIYHFRREKMVLDMD